MENSTENALRRYRASSTKPSRAKRALLGELIAAYMEMNGMDLGEIRPGGPENAPNALILFLDQHLKSAGVHFAPNTLKLYARDFVASARWEQRKANHRDRVSEKTVY